MLDPFGRSNARRQERSLIGWYVGVVDEVGQRVDTSYYEQAVKILECADGIRGFEDVKARNAQRVCGEVAGLLAEMRAT